MPQVGLYSLVLVIPLRHMIRLFALLLVPLHLGHRSPRLQFVRYVLVVLPEDEVEKVLDASLRIAYEVAHRDGLHVDLVGRGAFQAHISPRNIGTPTTGVASGS